MSADPLDAKRAQLAEAMKARRRWSPDYERQIAQMPESVLDPLLIYYTAPIRVG